MFKTIALSAVSFLALSSTAVAGSGIALESIVVSGDDVRVQYSSKIRSCGILIDEDGYKAQASPRLFCAPGVSNVQVLPSRAVDVVAGEAVQMCARALPRARKNRVYVSIATLRKMGLGDHLTTRGDGYLLHPDLEVKIED